MKSAPNVTSKADPVHADESDVSRAVDEICAAEGIARRKLLSIAVSDGEITVRYARSHGCLRTSTYPVASLRRNPGLVAVSGAADESVSETVTA